MPAWLLLVCLLGATAFSTLNDFVHLGAAAQLVLILLGVSFAVGVYLVRIRFEAWVRDRELVFRSRLVLGGLLNWPWAERRVAWRSIASFTVDRNPWSDQKKLTIVLDDGTSLEIPRPRSVAGSDTFDDFAAALKAIARADTGKRIKDGGGTWRFPILHAIVGGFVVMCGVMAVLSVQGMLDQKSSMILVIAGVMIVVAGVRLFLQNV